MKSKRFLGFASIVLMVLIGGFLVAPHELLTEVIGNPVTKKAKFTKVGNKKWKADPIHASQNDAVAWSDSTSDLYIQFMDATLFGVDTQTLKKGNTLTLTVRIAKNGTYPYAIFRTADSTFVTGDSPPIIIIP